MPNKTKQFPRLKSPILDSGCYVLGSRRGFTIVELLVAIGLFAVIVSIAMGGFVRALRIQRQIVALITANSNASLVIEQMSREMRTAFNFCETPCSTPPASSDSVNFTNSKGERVVYAFGTAPEGYGTITRQVNGGAPNQITAENVNIRYVDFYVLGNPLYPPRVTVLVGVSPRAGQAGSVSDNITNIQTTISARQM